MLSIYTQAVILITIYGGLKCSDQWTVGETTMATPLQRGACLCLGHTQQIKIAKLTLDYVGQFK